MIVPILILLAVEVLLIFQPTEGEKNKFVKHFILFANLGLIIGLAMSSLEIDIAVMHQAVSVCCIIFTTCLFTLFRKISNR
jgi:heme A synthase